MVDAEKFSLCAQLKRKKNGVNRESEGKKILKCIVCSEKQLKHRDKILTRQQKLATKIRRTFEIEYRKKNVEGN